MATAWFITNYKERTENGRTSRYCAMDDFTLQIYGAGGQWAETEVLGGNALVKVRAPQAGLDIIAGTPGFFRVPMNKLDLTLADITLAQRQNLRDRIFAMGYSQEEIAEKLGDTDWQELTLKQVFRFIATRRLKPRMTDGIIYVDGIVQRPRSIESVNAEVSEAPPSVDD